MNARAGLIGFITALIGVALILLYVRRVEQEASGGRKVQILVAVETIPRGELISENKLGTKDVPVAYVDDRVIRVSDKDKILNLRATSAVPVQQSLSWSDVVAANDDQRALSSLVQPGDRAVPLRAQITDSLPLVRPGDFVDILCVCGASKEATVLLQRVLVLAAGMNTSFASSAKDDFFNRVSIITVSVSLPDSQLLALAMEKGALTVAVRNAQDQRVFDSPAAVTMSALSDASQRPSTPNSRRRPSAPTQLKEVPVQ